MIQPVMIPSIQPQIQSPVVFYTPPTSPVYQQHQHQHTGGVYMYPEHARYYENNSTAGFMRAPSSGAPFVVMQHQTQIPYATQGPTSSMLADIDKDEDTLKRVLTDATENLRLATRQVRKNVHRGVKQTAVNVRLLSKLGIAASEPIPYDKPKGAHKALGMVKRFLGHVSSKLVPEMRKENQRHLVYVLEIVGTYVSSMNSLVSAKEEEPNDAEELEEEKNQINRLVIKLEDALYDVPNNKRKGTPAPKEAEIDNMMKVIALCREISERVQKIIQSADSSSGGTDGSSV
jgi:hypothetical protein